VQGVRERIAGDPEPAGPARDPRVQKFDLGAAPIISLALSGTLPPRELTRLARDVVEQRLGRIEGVGAIEIVGGRQREIHVVINPAQLAARGLTPAT
jgi:HAE1 family hydrophobic/amphiphilic exporter-1